MSTATNPVVRPVGTKTASQQLEEHRARAQALFQRQTKVRVELEAAARQLEEAQIEAERDFGTRDLDALRALYSQREQENTRAVTEFVNGLDALEQALIEVERQLVA